MDSEVALGSLVSAGYRYVKNPSKADIAIVNTCGFTEEAKRESIDAILELAELKKRGKIKCLVVMGCLSQRYGTELSGEILEADLWIGADRFNELPKLLAETALRDAPLNAVQSHPRFLPNGSFERFGLTANHFAYLKISEGCVNACAYCAIPKIKGRHRSRTPDDILQQAHAFAASGTVRELNVIGQDIAAYGWDLERRWMLPELISRVAQAAPKVWIRLLYAHPAHVTEEWIRLFNDHANVLPYLDLPIEHSHPAMLERMNRGVTRAAMDEVITRFRKGVPEMVLRTAVIVGFPGETDEEFEDLLRYMREVRFERLGAFLYSREEGTRAYPMEGQIDEALKRERYERVMELQAEISSEWGKKQIGRTLDVLMERKSAGSGLYEGRSYADAPDVDGLMLVRSSQVLKPGSIYPVRVTGAGDYDLEGECVGPESLNA